MRATWEVDEVRLLAALDEDVRLKFSLNKDVDEDKRHLHCFRVMDVDGKEDCSFRVSIKVLIMTKM